MNAINRSSTQFGAVDNIRERSFAKSAKAALVALAMIGGLATGITVATAPAFAQDQVVRLAAGGSKTVKVARAKPQTIRTDRAFSEIVVGDPEVAVVSPLTDRSFYVVGSKAGSTGIALYNENNDLVGTLDIEVGANTAQLNRELKRSTGNSGIRASSANGRVVLSGQAKSSVQAAKARELAKQFDENVVDAVSVAGSQQVTLEVRFVEAQRRNNKEVGVSVFARGDVVSRTGTSRTLDALGNVASVGTSLVSGSVPFGQLIGNIIDRGVNVDLLIQALQQEGIARSLAEPNLTALSGDTASFLAGGEFPIPVAEKDGAIKVEFKQFGVGLDFTPTVLDNGIINLRIAPEVSQIDTTNSVKFGDSGIEIPALTVRRAETTVELRDGQAFVLAGLLQRNSNYDTRKLPWLGDIPILGALFRSSAFRKNETDLVIIVTPRLVKPIAAGTRVATPLDATAPPNDADLFLNGETEISRAKLRRVADAENNILKSGHVITFD